MSSTSTYTAKQIFALTTMFGVAMWAITTLGGDFALGRFTLLDVTAYGILTLVVWVLVALYAMRIKWSYIIGIVVLVIGLVAGLPSPGTPAWYTFPDPLYDFATVVAYVVAIANIYFNLRPTKNSKSLN